MSDKSPNDISIKDSEIKAEEFAGRDINKTTYNINNYITEKISTAPQFTEVFDTLYDLMEKDDQNHCIKNNTQGIEELLHQGEGYITKKINYNELSDTTSINDMSSHIMGHFNMSDTELFAKTKYKNVNLYLKSLYVDKYKNKDMLPNKILNDLIEDLMSMVKKSSYNTLGEDSIFLCIQYLVYNAVLNCKVLEPAPENYRES